MPTYQYACTACDERLEVVQRFTDDPLTECAVCGGRLRKVFSPVGIVFKGPGFYRTDSRNGSSASKAKDSQANGSSSENAKPASGDSGSSSGETKSSESKSSTKTEAPAAGSSSKSAAKVA